VNEENHMTDCIIDGCDRPAAGWTNPDSPWREDGGQGRGHGTYRYECIQHTEVTALARTDPFRAEIMRQRLRAERP
jgi:hypothetical protein